MPQENILVFNNDDCCLANLFLSNIFETTHYYLVSNSITTGGLYYYIPSGESVTFDAGEEITLGPGFHANSGSDFLAKICGCHIKTKSLEYYSNDNEMSDKFSKFEYPKIDVMANENELQLALFPNPVSDILSIKCNLGIRKLDVFSNVGIVLISVDGGNNNDVSLDVSNLSTGSYQIRVTTINDFQIVKPFIKSH